MDSGVIEIRAKARGSLEGLREELLRLGKGKVASTSNVIYYLLEEKIGPNGEPITYTVMEFDEDGIVIRYTLNEEPAYFRKWEALKHIMPVLSLATKYYEVDPALLVELIDGLLMELKTIVKNDVKAVERENAKMRIKIKRLEERLRNCNNEIKGLLEKVYLKEREVEELKARVKKCETLSEEVLKEKIMEWIKDNNGEIDIVKFSKFYGIPETRVESAIYELIREGYLKPL